MSARRLGMAVIVALGLLLAVVGFSGAAVAYPDGVSPQISLSHNSGHVGNSIVVSGMNFTPKADSSLQFHSSSVKLKGIRTNSVGAFITTITVPDSSVGKHEVVAVDLSTAESVSVQFTILPAGVERPSAPTGDSRVAVVGAIAVLIVLLIGGFLSFVAGRQSGRLT